MYEAPTIDVPSPIVPLALFIATKKDGDEHDDQRKPECEQESGLQVVTTGIWYDATCSLE